MNSRKILIVGTGNVAYHLAKHFSALGHEITIISRSKAKGSQFNLELKSNFRILSVEANLTSDFVILAVPDDQIADVLDKYQFSNTIVLHASGAVDLKVLKDRTKNCGVLYPFQTFSKQKPVDFAQIPILIEGSDPTTLEKINNLALELSQKIHVLSSQERLKIHLAAVFACNFSNHLYTITDHLVQDSPLTFTDFSHLLEETVEKALLRSPKEAQTGPAIRKDHRVMQKHLELLKDSGLKELYKLHSAMISQSVGEE